MENRPVTVAHTGAISPLGTQMEPVTRKRSPTSGETSWSSLILLIIRHDATPNARSARRV